MYLSQLTAQGFATVPNVICGGECDALIASVAALDTESAGTRNLLVHDWCKALATHLQHHADLASLIPAGYVAAQCTYFEKSLSRNWLVPDGSCMSFLFKFLVH